MERRDTIQSVERALSILRLLSKAETLSLAEIAAAAGLPKGTAHGLIKTLEANGFAQQNPVTQRYSLGIEAYRVGTAFASRMDLRRGAEPLARRLSEELDDTVLVGTLANGYVVILLRVERDKPLALVPRIGSGLPAHCTALGKVLLSGLDEAELSRLFAERALPALTEYTITDPERLIEEVGKVRQRGYALNVQEALVGVYCVGAPIFDCSGRVVAALSVTCLTESLNVCGREEYVVGRVTSTARLISVSLGFQPSANS